MANKKPIILDYGKLKQLPAGDLIAASDLELFGASAAEVNAGTDDAKFLTAKSIKDSTNVPNVVPSTAGNVLVSDGTNWTSDALVASQVSDFDTEVANNTAVAANTDKISFDAISSARLADTSGTNTGDNAPNSLYGGLESNSITDLSEGNVTETTVDVVSSDGLDATLASASATRAGLLSKAKFDEIVVNTAYVGVGHVPLSQKGANNGVAELDATGLVPSTQLPSYVDDVLEFADYASLPVTGVTGKIYVTLDDNLTYRWSGTAYVEISASLALGETSSTAYRGDRGAIAYDHSQAPHAVVGATVNSTDAFLLDRTNHTGTQPATTISDFDVEVANNTAVAANTDKISFDAVSSARLADTSGTNTGDITVVDSTEIDLTLTGQELSASIVAGSIDETKLDASVNASLALADTALQVQTAETDPIFTASEAANITAGDITNLANLSGTNTGDQIISDETISITDLTVNNVSTVKHGFAPKGNGNTAEFLNGMGVYSAPLGGGDAAAFNYFKSDGDDVTLVYNLGFTPVDAVSTIITLNGIVQEPNVDYTVSGDNVTFVVAPLALETIEARMLTAGSGDLAGPASAVDNNLPTFDGTTGVLLKDSGISIDDVIAATAYVAVGHIPLSEKGSLNGVAELDGSGLVPASQLPSYVDDVIIVADLAALPAIGEPSKIYVTMNDNLTYRWSGTDYVEISASLALGETVNTAYRGDRGKIAYDHSQVPHAVVGATVNSTDAFLLDRTNHTGTQPATTISDFDVEVANNTAVAANTDKISFDAVSSARLADTSGTNTGDIYKATGAEVDTATDDAKYLTAKAVKDSLNVPSVSPGASGNVMVSDGTNWTSIIPAPDMPTITVVFSENVAAGDGINLYPNGGVINARKSDCTDNTKPCHGFVKEAILALASGNITPLVGDNAFVSGLTPGLTYFLSTSGGLTPTAPSVSGNIVQKLGLALSATSIWYNPGDVYEVA